MLVIEPGTSAGGASFVPLAQWIVSRAKNWQVWSVERRENLLEDQSELNLAKRDGATATQVFETTSHDLWEEVLPIAEHDAAVQAALADRRLDA